MARDTETALNDLSSVFTGIYSTASSNLGLLRQKKGMFSNPYKRVALYEQDKIAHAMEFEGDGGRNFVLLTHVEGTKVDFSMHERLMHLANGTGLCNVLRESIDKSMKDPALAQQLMLETQSIAIRAALLRQFTAFASEVIGGKKLNADNSVPVVSAHPERAQHYSDRFGDDLKKLSQLLVDNKLAGDLIKSMSMPFTPAILGNKREPDARTFNGVWVTADMHRQMDGSSRARTGGCYEPPAGVVNLSIEMVLSLYRRADVSADVGRAGPGDARADALARAEAKELRRQALQHAMHEPLR